MLIPKSDFLGLAQVTHLCAGAETPILKSHRSAVDRFFEDKSGGTRGRDRMLETYDGCKRKVATLLGVSPKEIAFLSSSSEGINLVAHSLEWNRGDNVVLCDLEFPSDVLPWTRLDDQGVEIRIIHQRNWSLSLSDLGEAIDDRTRVVAVSQVSFLTGQRLRLEQLAELVRQSHAVLSLDATHGAGVVEVPAGCADVLVSSCYKWLLGVHGLAIFYCNAERQPDLRPPFLGWHTAASFGDWRDPTRYSVRPEAARFEPGNPSFVGIYILDNALDRLLEIGISRIEAYVASLADRVWKGIEALGLEVMTPQNKSQRAGNVCFSTPNSEAIATRLEERGILVWPGSGRVRISTHLYNTVEDVDRLLSALREVLPQVAPSP